MTHLWFRAKAYGWGWYPASIEGWLVLGLFVVGVVADVFLLKHRMAAGSGGMAWTIFSVALAVLVGLLIAVCWMTGERPRWHWGD